MAKDKHVEIIKKGVEVWNDWRLDNTITKKMTTRPDLTGADLQEMRLIQVDFIEVDLIGANLTGADFNGAYLQGANLHDADLSNANLQGANLHGADLSNADLFNIKLKYADLSGADLSNANLRNADMTKTNLDKTILCNTNLTDVKHLATCFHLTSSTIDNRTIAISGSLPIEFLRGCGLTNWEIENSKLYDPSLTQNEITKILQRIFEFRTKQPMQLYSCFVSYSHKDQVFAKKLYDDLQNSGVRCWFAPEDMKIGDRIRLSIDEKIRDYDKLLLILSKNSINSQWVEQEVETALRKERKENATVLFPIRLDNEAMNSETGWPALVKDTRNIGDFCHWKKHGSYKKAFDRLLRDLRA